MGDSTKKWFSLNLNSKEKQSSDSCGCGKTTGGCSSHTEESISDDAFMEAAVNASIGGRKT